MSSGTLSRLVSPSGSDRPTVEILSPGIGALQLRSMAELAAWRAQHQPDRRAFVFLDPDAERELSYGELFRMARAVAVRLTAAGLRGRPTILLYVSTFDFLVGLYGCLLADVIAITSCAPHMLSSTSGQQRIVDVARNAGACAILTSRTFAAVEQPRAELVPGLAALDWLTSDDVDLGLAEDWSAPDSVPDSVAVLQYTSGSTGSAKGVIATHRNLLRQSAQLSEAQAFDEQSVVVNWLPSYHDMGLLLGSIQPMVAGMPAVLIPTASFMRRPLSWLGTITRFKGTHSGAPNFAYELCTRRLPASNVEFDLSTWKCAPVAAEPVRKDTVRRFYETFRQYGLRWEALAPAYGMCEATLMVTHAKILTGPRFCTVDRQELERNRRAVLSDGAGSTTLAACGSTFQDTRVLIVDPETRREVPAGQSGEVWISGSTLSPGYWQQPEATQATFQARLADTNEGPFLRSGDLGYIDHGELVISGRIKELIIVAGRNYSPHDIEAVAAASDEAARFGATAAFSVEIDDEERVIVMQEVRNASSLDVAHVSESIRRAVAREIGIQLHSVLLVRARSIPKTTSGKIMRRACREMYLKSLQKRNGAEAQHANP